MTETPYSDRTVYFDAPLAHYSMSHTDTTGLAQPQGNGAAKPIAQNHQPLLYHDVYAKRDVASRDSIGWLPAIDLFADSTTEPGRQRSIIRPGGNGGGTVRLRPADHTEGTADADRTHDASDVRRSGSPARTGSLSRRSIFSGVECRPTSPFIHGAGTTATAPPNEELSTRAASADAQLTSGQKSRIDKLEGKKAKRLSKIIIEEGKVEKKALDGILDELAELQNLQKKAVKDEAKVHAVYAKLLELARKHEVEYMESKARYDATLVRLQSEEQVLEKIKENAREATQQIRAKTQELDSLRAVFGVDERERELRLMQLTGKKSSSPFWRQ